MGTTKKIREAFPKEVQASYDFVQKHRNEFTPALLSTALRQICNETRAKAKQNFQKPTGQSIRSSTSTYQVTRTETRVDRGTLDESY